MTTEECPFEPGMFLASGSSCASERRSRPIGRQLHGSSHDNVACFVVKEGTECSIKKIAGGLWKSHATSVTLRFPAQRGSGRSDFQTFTYDGWLLRVKASDVQKAYCRPGEISVFQPQAYSNDVKEMSQRFLNRMAITSC